MKSSRRSGYWLAAAMILICAWIMIGCYDSSIQYVRYEYEKAEEAENATEEPEQSWPAVNSTSLVNLKSFIRYMYVGSYGMYWELEQKEQQKEIAPSELFFAESARSTMDTGILSEFDEEFREWYSNFGSLLEQYSIDYRIVNTVSGEAYTNASGNLEQHVSGTESYPFFLWLSFWEDGVVEIRDLQNKDGLALAAEEVRGLNKERFLRFIGMEDMHAFLLGQPENVEIYLASDNENCYYSIEGQGQESYETAARITWYQGLSDEIILTYLLLLLAVTVLTFLLPPFKRIRRTNVWIARIPAEAAVGGAFLTLALQEAAVSKCMDYILYQRGSSVAQLGYFMMYVLIFTIWFLSIMVLLQIQDVGARRFFSDRSVLYRNIDRILMNVRQFVGNFVASIRDVDLSDPSDRWLLRVVAVNFAFLTVCCVIWFWGILGLVVYSAFLFFILRKFLGRVKRSYGVLLRATSQMAQGDLHVEVDGDLGVFAPLGEELKKVNEGFSKAVEQEMSSQNMKTELITNVSHDLKTPLTAIITYINLLKDESITPEERRSYIEILDRKSLRLKKLIEDLFEVSKAASGNIKVELRQVDLCEIIKQAVLEQEDRFAEAQIDCRVQVPEGRVLLFLDGEKTYRILENLLVNVTKYALAGTRAWVTLRLSGEAAEITVKNTSAAELDEDCTYLTDRFVRGDKSRNTEGSGLGLAIVKSFIELQGGSFRIETDGDLFKTIVTFPETGLQAEL